MVRAILLLLFVGLLVGCGSDVAAQPFQTTITPVVTPTVAPVATATPESVEIDTLLVRCTTGLAFLAAHHRHSVSVEVSGSVDTVFSQGQVRGSGDGKTGAPGLKILSGIFASLSNKKVVDLLNQNCGSFIDAGLFERLGE